MSDPADRKSLLVPGVVGVVLGMAAVWMVASSLRRPELPTYPLSPLTVREVGAALDTGTVTLDVTAEDRWVLYDFSRRSLVDETGGLDWDLGIHRSDVIVNGGEAFDGRAGILDLGPVPFDSVTEVPADGYVVTEAGRDSVHAVLEGWYDYSFTSHVLTPKDRTYAVRTADGRYAKLRILSYYCPGARPGCLTLRYAYQGDGSRRVVP